MKLLRQTHHAGSAENGSSNHALTRRRVGRPRQMSRR
jgi:hypothetical protein